MSGLQFIQNMASKLAVNNKPSVEVKDISLDDEDESPQSNQGNEFIYQQQEELLRRAKIEKLARDEIEAKSKAAYKARLNRRVKDNPEPDVNIAEVAYKTNLDMRLADLERQKNLLLAQKRQVKNANPPSVNINEVIPDRVNLGNYVIEKIFYIAPFSERSAFEKYRSIGWLSESEHRVFMANNEIELAGSAEELEYWLNLIEYNRIKVFFVSNKDLFEQLINKFPNAKCRYIDCVQAFKLQSIEYGLRKILDPLTRDIYRTKFEESLLNFNVFIFPKKNKAVALNEADLERIVRAFLANLHVNLRGHANPRVYNFDHAVIDKLHDLSVIDRYETDTDVVDIPNPYDPQVTKPSHATLTVLADSLNNITLAFNQTINKLPFDTKLSLSRFYDKVLNLSRVAFQSSVTLNSQTGIVLENLDVIQTAVNELLSEGDRCMSDCRARFLRQSVHSRQII